MQPKSSFCSSQNSQKLASNPLKGPSTLENDKKNGKLGKAFDKAQIQIKNEMLDDLLQVYSWRSKNQLPIAKVMFYKVVLRNPNEPFTTVEVSYEAIYTTLSDMKQIEIQNLVYMLRESMIGFEKLFSVFGSFLISNKMIGINKNNRCKVWINQNFSINEPIDVEMFKNLSQQEFVSQIMAIFKKKCQKSRKSEVLFNQLVHLQTFEEVVSQINNFSKHHNIQVGNCWKIEEREQVKNLPSKSPIKNMNQMTNRSFIGNQNKHIPKFLNSSIIKDGGKTRKNQDRQKNRSLSRSNIRRKTPLNHNQSQISFYNPLKQQMKTSGGVLNNKQKPNDYSFETKNKKSSPIDEKRPKLLAASPNSFSYQDVEEIFKGKSILNSLKKVTQPNQVMKYDLNTASTNNSSITTKFKNLVQKTTSLFKDEQKNMFESVVEGQQHQRRQKSMHSTFDLEKLGKLGKHVGQSYMPEDFLN